MTKEDKEYRASLINFIKTCESNDKFSKRVIENQKFDIALSKKRIAIERQSIAFSKKRIAATRQAIRKLDRKK